VIVVSTLTPSHPFRAAAESGDIEALVATLAPDVALHSPVTVHPYVGRETVGGILRFVSEAFDGWRCIEELHVRPCDQNLLTWPRSGRRRLAMREAAGEDRRSRPSVMPVDEWPASLAGERERQAGHEKRGEVDRPDPG